VDFSSRQKGDARAWLEDKKGGQFEFGRDAAKFEYAFDARGLTIKTVKPAAAVLLRRFSRTNPAEQVEQPAQLTVRWGVEQYPAGADWGGKYHSEAIMVLVFFGETAAFIPKPSPYFIGFFLCPEGHGKGPFEGRYFKKIGRYICIDSPKAGTDGIVTRVDLKKAFTDAFHISDVPPVSGFAIEADTSDLNRLNSGRSSAWIRSIQVESSKR
jgi:hypothetical protein